MKFSRALLATIATTNVADAGQCPESHPYADIRIGKCCKDLVCTFPDYISCPSLPVLCVNGPITDDEEPTQTHIEGYLPCPDTHPWEFIFSFWGDDYHMCCTDQPTVDFAGDQSCAGDRKYRAYDYDYDDDDEEPTQTDIGDEEPTQTDLPGYKPCPDTHPWEYKNSFDYHMCCPEKPLYYELGGFECDLASVYREYDYGDDIDASKCPACWKENDANECEFDTSATECFTQTCNNGAMQLSINFENLFNSKAADIGDYDATIGVDLENWPSQSIEFTDNAILMKLKLTTDDLNDPDVTCGTKTNLGGHEVVVATGAGPCLEVNFVCSFPREVELSSDGFVVENPMTVGKTTDENGPPTVAGNIKDSFKPIEMVNEDGDAVTDDNVKLGSKISASLESTLTSDRLGLYVKDCSIKEGDQVVPIIKNGCYASAVGASFVDDYISSAMKASIQWSTFIMGTFQKTTSNQILTCTARFCDSTSCKSEVDALICPIEDTLSYVHAKDIE